MCRILVELVAAGGSDMKSVEDGVRPRSRLVSFPRNVSSSTSLRSLQQTPLPGHASKPQASVAVRLVEMQPSQPEVNLSNVQKSIQVSVIA